MTWNTGLPWDAKEFQFIELFSGSANASREWPDAYVWSCVRPFTIRACKLLQVLHAWVSGRNVASMLLRLTVSMADMWGNLGWWTSFHLQALCRLPSSTFLVASCVTCSIDQLGWLWNCFCSKVCTLCVFDAGAWMSGTIRSRLFKLGCAQSRNYITIGSKQRPWIWMPLERAWWKPHSKQVTWQLYTLMMLLIYVFIRSNDDLHFHSCLVLEVGARMHRYPCCACFLPCRTTTSNTHVQPLSMAVVPREDLLCTSPIYI